MEVMATHRQVPVVEASQPSAARFAAQEAARIAGFDAEDEYRAGLVATELATNLVKHARQGEMLIRGSSGERPEVEILAIDRGPGMTDLSRSMADGHSTAGTTGNGLGAVRRLADDFDIHSQRDRGTVVLARLRRDRAPGVAAKAVDVGGVSVPVAGETVCGDAWLTFNHGEGVVAVIADGLGHGLHAGEAAVAALLTIDPRREMNLPDMLQVMHAGTRHTRGAAVAIADLRMRAKIVKFAGIGNIAGTISRPASTRHAVSLSGTLGHEVRQFRDYSYPWEPDAALIMHSDGLATHWSLDDYPGLRTRQPSVVAAVLYRDHSRRRDDVTVVVAREITTEP